MAKLLIIEDDATIVEGLETIFAHHGFAVLHAPDGEAGMGLFRADPPDLVILDIMLPGNNGFQVCREIRDLNRDVPIVMLTAKSQESDKLMGFELGADDYVTKPFSAMELLARVKALLRRGAGSSAAARTIKLGDALINFDNFTVEKGRQTLVLSPKERDILKLLAEHPDTVISRSRMIDEVWGDEYFPNPKTIDNFIRKLRAKVEANPQKPVHIQSVHGAGYILKP
jgi:DNA-binding response OmpR family regulator